MISVSNLIMVFFIAIGTSFVLGMKIAIKINDKYLNEEREYIDTLIREKNKEIENGYYY